MDFNHILFEGFDFEEMTLKTSVAMIKFSFHTLIKRVKVPFKESPVEVPLGG